MHIIFNEWEATCFGPYRTIIRPQVTVLIKYYIYNKILSEL
jgi:hypothetical protein